MTSRRIVELLDKPLNTLPENEFREIFCEFPEEIAYLMARTKARPEDPVTLDQIGLQLELAWRFPHGLEHYRARAIEARRRRADLDPCRLATYFTKPQISAGAR